MHKAYLPKDFTPKCQNGEIYQENYGCHTPKPFREAWIVEKQNALHKCTVTARRFDENQVIDNAEERLGKKLRDEFHLPGYFVKDAMTLQFVTYEEDAYKGNEALRPHLKLSLDNRFCSILMPDGEGNFRPLCGDHYMTLGCPDQENNCQRREHAIWRFETGGVCTPSQPSGSNIPQDVYQILSDAYAALWGSLETCLEILKMVKSITA